MEQLHQNPDRPLPVTIVTVIQGVLSIYSLTFAILAVLNPQMNLGLLRSAMRLLIGRTDYYSFQQAPHDSVISHFVGYVAIASALTLYGARTCWGLWRLEKWARHSIIGEYGMMLILWLRSFFVFGIAGGFSRTPERTLQPIYAAVFTEAMVCLMLLYSGGVAEAFGEQE